jgi:hypothetical protein
LAIPMSFLFNGLGAYATSGYGRLKPICFRRKCVLDASVPKDHHRFIIMTSSTIREWKTRVYKVG